MGKIKLSELRAGFEALAGGTAVAAFVEPGSGAIVIHTETATAPADGIPVPNREVLDLGQRMAWRFALAHRRELLYEIVHTFRLREPFKRLEGVLAAEGLLEAWQAHVHLETEAALRRWCVAQGLQVAESD